MPKNQDAKARSKIRRQTYMLFIAMATPLIIYIALHMGYVQDSPNENPGEVILKAIIHITEKPLVMFPNSIHS